MLGKKVKIFFIIFILFSLIPKCFVFCETSQELLKPEDQVLISQILKKYSHLKNSSFQCEGNLLGILHKGPNEEEVIAQYQEEFTYRKGDFYRKTISYISPKISKEISLDSVKNLLEHITKRLYRGYSGKLENIQTYSVNGKITSRTIFIENEKQYIYQETDDGNDPLGTYPDPRILVGYFGSNLLSLEDTENALHITDYLNMPGKTFYYEKEGYKIIYHFVEELYKQQKQFGIEIWINPDGNIEKMIEGYYYTLILGEEKIKQILDGIEIEIKNDFPAYLVREYKWSDFEYFDINGEKISIPQKIEITDYSSKQEDKPRDPLCIEKHKEYFSKGKHIEAAIIRSACLPPQQISLECFFNVNKGSFKANIDISDDIFIPPTVTSFDNMKKKTLWDNIKNIPTETTLFIFACLILTLCATFLTRKYWGWGL